MAEDTFKCFHPGKIRVVENNKKIVSKKEFCINHATYDLISFNCIQDKSCRAISAYTEGKTLNQPYTTTGNPDHMRCSLLGGQPQLIEYFHGLKWIETGICHFNDLSFISVFNKI